MTWKEMCYLKVEENQKIGYTETEYGTITTCKSENMSIHEDKCLDSSIIESSNDSSQQLYH